MGLVKTPTMPFPTPEITPLALLPAELWISQLLWKFCIGWSTMPAMAPARRRDAFNDTNKPVFPQFVQDWDWDRFSI